MRFLRQTEYHDVATRLLREFHSGTHLEFTVLERSNGFLLSFILFSLSSLLLCRYSCRYYYYLSSLHAIFAPSSELERERETNFNYINDSIVRAIEQRSVMHNLVLLSRNQTARSNPSVYNHYETTIVFAERIESTFRRGTIYFFFLFYAFLFFRNFLIFLSCSSFFFLHQNSLGIS